MKNLNRYCNTLLCLTLFIIINNGCTNDPIVFDPDSLGEYYTRSEISPQQNKVGVLVGKTVPEDMPVDISGALVYMSNPLQTVKLTEEKPGFYLDTNNEFIVQPGYTHRLQVDMPGGPLMTAQTTVPGDFHFTNPAEMDTLEYVVCIQNNPNYNPGAEILHSPTISWSKSQHALSYRIDIIRKQWPVFRATTPDTNCLAQKIYLEYELLRDSTLSYIDEKCILKVSALDSNSQTKSNMTGGMGYFSSFNSIIDTVIVRYRKEENEI